MRKNKGIIVTTPRHLIYWTVVVAAFTATDSVGVEASWIRASPTRTSSCRHRAADRTPPFPLWATPPSAADKGENVGTRTTTTSPPSQTLQQVPFFGNVYRLSTGNDDPDDTSFVAHMGVPTFAVQHQAPETDEETPSQNWNVAPSLSSTTDPLTARTLPRIQPASVLLQNVVSKRVCQQIIQACEDYLGFQDYQAGKNHHGALQLMVPQTLVDALATRIQPFLDIQAVQTLDEQMSSLQASSSSSSLENYSLRFVGLNPRWRIYRYAPGGKQSFAPHIDAAFPKSGLTPDGKDIVWDVSTTNKNIRSRLTLLLYLNDDFEGGETIFFEPLSHSQQQQQQQQHTETAVPPLLQAVQPQTGACLLFPQAVGEDAVAHARQHWPLHEGSPVIAGSPKYVIRSDVLFAASTTATDT